MSTLPELPWMVTARSLIGEREIKGPKHNSKIVAMWTSIRSTWFTDDETPWCAGFIGHCLEVNGIKSTRSAAAASYRNFGVKLDRPAYGCIAVKGRTGGNHVTFIVGRDRQGRLLGLGGNQNDMVKISTFPANAFDTFVWPTIYPRAERFDLPVLTSDGKTDKES